MDRKNNLLGMWRILMVISALAFSSTFYFLYQLWGEVEVITKPEIEVSIFENY